MFRIDFEILEREKERLSGVKNSREFEEELNNVLGQMEVTFNDRAIGSMDNDDTFYGDYLLTWFQEFNEVIVELEESRFVTMMIPDGPNVWLEFEESDNMLKVNKIQAGRKIRVGKNVLTEPKVREKFYWTETISKDEFVSQVISHTGKFMLQITTLNEILSRSREVMILERLFQKAKKIYSLS